MNPARTQFNLVRRAPDHSAAQEQRVERLMPACASYPKSDRPMFMAGYRELCRVDLTGKRVLEICCANGELSRQLAGVFPGAEVIAMDRYPEGGSSIVQAQASAGLTNARYYAGDATRLVEFADASLDLIFGQATLHHLVHDGGKLRDEAARVLKPGGRLIFIFEPLGHNPIWAMIRAYRIARMDLVDESNVVLRVLEEMAAPFSRCEVQPFNLVGYPFKSLGRFASAGFMNWIDRVDVALMQGRPGLAKMAANFNVVFTK